MPTFITPYWQYGSNGDYAPDGFVGTSENDTFQLGGSEAGTSGGIRNGWDTFSGGFGTDRIYIAPKSGFSWTAAYIDTNGLDSVERIEFHDSLSVRPVYFQSSVNFSSVTYMSLNTKVYGSGFSDTFLGAASVSTWKEMPVTIRSTETAATTTFMVTPPRITPIRCKGTRSVMTTYTAEMATISFMVSGAMIGFGLKPAMTGSTVMSARTNCGADLATTNSSAA
jgi:hypothetical protein